MNIKQFVEEAEKEMQEASADVGDIVTGYVVQLPLAMNIQSSKLRELIGEVRKSIKAEIEKNHTAKCIHTDDYDCSDIHVGRAEALSDVLHLFDEAGGGK